MSLQPSRRAVVPGQTVIRVSSAAGHAGFPGMAVCADGSLLAVWRQATQHGYSQGSACLAARSRDAGRTWSAPWVIHSSPNYDTGIATLTRLVSGRLINVGNLAYGGSSRAAVVAHSDDQGATWSAPRALPFTWAAWSFTSGNVVELSDGALVTMAYGQDVVTPATSVRSLRSTDGGLTWSDEAWVDDPSTRAGGAPWFSEAWLGVLEDGTLMALLRNDAARVIYRTTSSDGGLTWATPVPALIGWGRPCWARLSSGLLVVAYRRASDDAHGMRISYDDGVTWDDEQLLAPRRASQSVYCQLEEVSAGLIGVVFADEESPTIANTRFKYLLDTPVASPFGDLPVDDTGWRTDNLTAEPGWSLAGAMGYAGLAWRVKGGRVDVAGIAIKNGAWAANEAVARLPESVAPDRVVWRDGVRVYPDRAVRIVSPGSGAVVVGVDYPL